MSKWFRAMGSLPLALELQPDAARGGHGAASFVVVHVVFSSLVCRPWPGRSSALSAHLRQLVELALGCDLCAEAICLKHPGAGLVIRCMLACRQRRQETANQRP